MHCEDAETYVWICQFCVFHSRIIRSTQCMYDTSSLVLESHYLYV
jgi:hypothetical protein